ncbi:MAG: DnaT-like ssDNA-binding protein [Pseudomonadota bacterium]
MSIIVEDGTGIAGSNSYASVAEADAFHALRLNADWAAATDPQKVSALVRSTDYIRSAYRVCGAPDQVKTATIMLALYALAGSLSAPAERGIKSSTEKLEGTGEFQTVYDDAAPTDPYPMITALLDGIADRKRPDAPAGLVVGRLIR